MNHITFSHNYQKLAGTNATGFLISVSLVKLKDMPKDFIHYDTLFYGEKLVEQHYELKEGSYLILLFWSNGKLFTTIRPHNNQKFKYYFSLIGQEFEIIINKESI